MLQYPCKNSKLIVTHAVFFMLQETSYCRHPGRTLAALHYPISVEYLCCPRLKFQYVTCYQT